MDDDRQRGRRQLSGPGVGVGGTGSSGSTRLRVFSTPAVPVVTILVLAGIFDGISGNPIHSILLLATAVALTRNEVLERRVRQGRHAAVTTPLEPLEVTDVRAARRLTFVVLSVAAVFGLVVGGFARYSWPATMFILIPASAGLIVSWRGPVRRSPEGEPLDVHGILAWVSVFVVLGLWELTSLLLQPTLTTDSYAHPTISVMTDPILAFHPGRTVAIFLWLALGWFLLGR